MVKFSTSDVDFDDYNGFVIGRESQGGKSYPLDYRNSWSGGRKIISKIPSFYVPSGMQKAVGPSDPDTTEGSSLRDIQNEGLELVLEKEVEEFGDGLYLVKSAADALGFFVGTDSYRRDGIFQPYETRWGYRPPVINHMAGGEDASYHMKGMAVDLQLTRGAKVNVTNLMSCVVNSIASGFRCIGFGGVQFHMDTREVGGFMGYVYPHTWREYFAPGSARMLGIPEAEVFENKLLTPTLIFKLYLMYYSKYFPRQMRVDKPLDVRDVNGIVRDRTIPSVADSDNVRYAHISEDNIRKYVTGIISASTQVVSVNSPTPKPESQSAGSQSRSEPTYTPQPTSTETPYIFTPAGQTDLITLGVLGAVILGGFYGFKAFFRGIRNRSERARYEREVRRLLSKKSRRELISDFRVRHYNQIVKAKRDPRLARQLEMKLGKILAKNGYPIY